MPLSFGDGVVVQVVPPGVPTFQAPALSPAALAVVPVQGPAGPQGPPGDSSSALAYVQNVTPSMTTVLINHNLPFQPAGILCLDTTGATILGATITHPQDGWIELVFGAPFGGLIFLS